MVDAIQTIAFEDVPTIPLGQYFPRTAMRSNVTGFRGRRRGAVEYPARLVKCRPNP